MELAVVAGALVEVGRLGRGIDVGVERREVFVRGVKLENQCIGEMAI